MRGICYNKEIDSTTIAFLCQTSFCSTACCLRILTMAIKHYEYFFETPNTSSERFNSACLNLKLEASNYLSGDDVSLVYSFNSTASIVQTELITPLLVNRHGH